MEQEEVDAAFLGIEEGAANANNDFGENNGGNGGQNPTTDGALLGQLMSLMRSAGSPQPALPGGQNRGMTDKDITDFYNSAQQPAQQQQQQPPQDTAQAVAEGLERAANRLANQGKDNDPIGDWLLNQNVIPSFTQFEQSMNTALAKNDDGASAMRANYDLLHGMAKNLSQALMNEVGAQMQQLTQTQLPELLKSHTAQNKNSEAAFTIAQNLMQLAPVRAQQNQTVRQAVDRIAAIALQRTNGDYHEAQRLARKVFDAEIGAVVGTNNSANNSPFGNRNSSARGTTLTLNALRG